MPLAPPRPHPMPGREVVVVSAVRTPIGGFLGGLSTLPAPRLGAAAIRAALERAGVEPGAVDEVVMGNVLQAGQGQAPARQAALLAGVPERAPATTLNKMCGSGMAAVIAGARIIALGEAEVVVAGGMESMSQAPYYDRAARTGARMGNQELVDGLLHDGLLDPYRQEPMGLLAERCAEAQDLSRAAQDAYALESTRRAQAAQRSGAFAAELVPVEVAGARGERAVVAEDEGPRAARPEKIPTLRPAFKPGGTVTAASASSISDGAAALVLMSAERARAEGRAPLGRLAAWGGAARAPADFTIAPADAVRTALARVGLGPGDVELWEINEAFAVVALANARLLGIDLTALNVRGGAVALGHPLGASGARILVTLLHALRDLGRSRGLASICIGGGEALAMVIER